MSGHEHPGRAAQGPRPQGPQPHGPRPRAPRSQGPRSHGPLPAELAGLLAEIVPADGRFGHQQHIHLAYLTARRHGTAEAIRRISDWIQHIAVYERAPQKYNATMTRAWTQLVGHHVETDAAAGDFDSFAVRHPALLDKRLLSRHYRSATLASAAARSGWVEPDLAPFPFPA
jgi:hypothetical protein